MGQSNNVDEALERLTEVRQNIENAQTGYFSQLSALRIRMYQLYVAFFSERANIVKSGVSEINNCDDDARATLAEVQDQQAPCVATLSNLIDEFIVIGGNRVSNCIRDALNASRSDGSFQDLSLSTALERSINYLSGIPVNAIITRNIYTQYNEVVSFAEQTFAATSADIEADLVKLDEKNVRPGSWDKILSDFSSCFNRTRQSVMNGMEYLTGEVPECQQFARNGRSRSSPTPKVYLDPSVFFQPDQ